MNHIPTVAAALLLHLSPAVRPEGPAPRRWGSTGHQMAAHAAVKALPVGVPDFFLEAGDQLVYLDPEPDRWRVRELVAMDQMYSYDHYIDMEHVPSGALEAPDRYAFIRTLHDAGVERPERDVGFLPYRILELYQRVVTEWRMWRAAADPTTRRWIEQRIVNDAGILGHYVTDAANPHHTTIHHNGWAEGVPNPNGYTTDRRFHGRFESAFVEAHIRQADVDQRMGEDVQSVAGHAWAAILAHIRESHDRVDELYRLEKSYGFDPAGPDRPETDGFVADRLAAGARMLRTLWWSAWLESASAP
jgi:hypothetical protein